jgi:selenocysteine-specific elongation factor
VAERHAILGTAGHIDHGKTELVRALTGVDTDRLREEKERGISIELGFARLDLPSGATLGIVDVPGHERFVKTMLAGAGGIDIALLVIAADEGVMPQTREHLDIIDLLGIGHGVVAITKADLVSEEDVEFAAEEASELLEGTALESAPVVPVSSITGEGLDRLRAVLDKATASVVERSSTGPARLPVDRVFTLEGHGTIVTGTLWSGSVSPGDTLELYPEGRSVRVRSVQVHDNAVERAEAGQRTALGLAGVPRGSVGRGDTLGSPGGLAVATMLDARLRLVPSARTIENRTRVHFHLGTTEALARIVLLESEMLKGGEDALVQLRLESPVVAERGDLFVLRSYSPVTTIGGGRVIDPSPERHKRLRDEVIESIHVIESGSPEDVLLKRVEDAGYAGLSEKDVGEGPEQAAMTGALERGDILRVAGRLLTPGNVHELHSRILETLDASQRRTPLEWGMSSEELRGRVARGLDRALLDAALGELEAGDAVHRRGDLVRAGSPDVRLTPSQRAVAEGIVARLRDAGASPPDVDEMKAGLNDPDFDGVLKLLAAEGRIIRLTTSLYVDVNVMDDVRRAVVGRLDEAGEISVPEFKDLVGVTRKHAIPLLEFLDREGTTMRAGNVRRRGRSGP